jgi:expansin (peptidoglycan-binding protein)
MISMVMAHPFLSPEWFTAVDALIAAAGDLKIPAAMAAAEINVTITSPRGEKQVYVKDGRLFQGHRDAAPTAITLPEELARKVFVEADTAAGIQAFLAGELVATGDLKSLVAMQMEEPSAEQKALAKRIAAITG